MVRFLDNIEHHFGSLLGWSIVNRGYPGRDVSYAWVYMPEESVRNR